MPIPGKKNDTEVLFLVPPKDMGGIASCIDRVYGCNYGFDYKPPIHLLLLATVAKAAGCRVRLLDCPAEGIDRKKFILYLKHSRPVDAVVVFSVWLSGNQDKEAAGLVSSEHKGVKKIFTGPLPTWKPEFFIDSDSDFVIRGEPEEALIELLSAFDQEDRSLIRNISFFSQGRVRHNPSRDPANINELPIPDRRLLLGKYSFTRIASSPATVMCASRGCSYQCTYCAPHALDQAIETEKVKKEQGKPPLRIRDAGRVIDEFREIAGLGYRGVEICDNQFVWDARRVDQICAAISNLGLEWICCGRADYLQDAVMLRSMRKAGCRQIYIGTESFCQEILDDTRKELQLEDIYKALSMVRQAGIEPEISVLLGASGKETESTIAASYRQAKKCKTRFVHFSVALPLPHTQLYRTAKEQKWLRAGDFIPTDNIRGALLDLPHIKAKRLQFLVRSFYLRQYLAPSFIARQLLSKGFYLNFSFRVVSFLKLLAYLLKERGRA